jgi:hypothetical protein
MQIKLCGESSATEVGNFFAARVGDRPFSRNDTRSDLVADEVTLRSLTQSHVSGLLNSND